MAFILFACKKEKEVTPEYRNDMTIHIVFGQNKDNWTASCANAQIKLYNEAKQLVGIYYTNNQGIVNFKNLQVGQMYKWTFQSPTYYFASDPSVYHHYEYTNLDYDNTRLNTAIFASSDFWYCISNLSNGPGYTGSTPTIDPQ